MSGKFSLTKKSILSAAAFFFTAVIVMCTVMILKFVFVSKIVFEQTILAYAMIAGGIILIMSSFFVYTAKSRKALIANPKSLYAVSSAVVIAYAVNIFAAIGDVVVMPVCMAAFIIAPISKRRDAFMGNIFANILITYTLIVEVAAGSNMSIFGIVIMFMVGISAGSVASYTISSNTRRVVYILKGFLIETVSLGVVIAFNYISPRVVSDYSELLVLAVIGVYSPLVFGFVLQPLLESIFNLITNSKLVELTDHNSPLIKRLRLETPGTFNHCQAVATFAEICASAIGENPYLAKACAYYHDVGKLSAAIYFKENQGEMNPHDELLPEVSADIIRSHTTEGLKLCRKYRIPAEISHVTVQHHGTMLIPVFYKKAQQLTDGFVDPYEYSYRGETPVTKIAAIIMLCDVGEAAIRAMDSPDGEKVDKMMTTLINDRIKAGQFDNCDISLRDLDTIKKIIINSYGGLFHKRVAYPDGEKR